MVVDERSLSGRHQILSAYVAVLQEPDRLLAVCASVEGDDDELRAAVAEIFTLSEIEADAVLRLQVSRFSPAQLRRVRQELTEVEQRLSELNP